MAWSNIYFIGIGGIGMSAIARYYKFKGYSVGGYARCCAYPVRRLRIGSIRKTSPTSPTAPTLKPITPATRSVFNCCP